MPVCTKSWSSPGGQAQRERRHQQVLAADAELVQPRSDAAGRQDAVGDREQQHEQHPGHVRRRRHAERGDGAEQVLHGAAPRRAHDVADEAAADERQQQRADGQLDRVEQAVADQLGDRRVQDVGVAEVAGDDAAQPHQVLQRKRPVEAEVAADRRHCLVARVGPGQRGGRVPRREAQQQEDDQRRQEHHHDRGGEPAKHIADHGYDR
jgi:hypothetical protein